VGTKVRNARPWNGWNQPAFLLHFVRDKKLSQVCNGEFHMCSKDGWMGSKEGLDQ
jgi:hypothetical protein